MFTINLYDNKAKLVSITSKTFNYSTRWHESTNYSSLRLDSDTLRDSIEILDILTPHITKAILIEVIEDSKFVCKFDNIVLESVVVDSVNSNYGVMIELRKLG